MDDFEKRAQMAWILAVLAYTDDDFAYLQKRFSMTQDLWEHCICLCLKNQDMKQFWKLWHGYPEMAGEIKRKLGV